MSTATEMNRFLCPVPACESKHRLKYWVYVLADRARAKLVATGGIGSSLFPLGKIAATVAEECICQDIDAVKDKNEAEFLRKMDEHPFMSTGWLAGAIVEILSMDGTTQEWLRSQGLPSREVRKGRK